MVELVIYALLAAFIFSRLYSSLGKSNSLNLKKLTNILEVSKVEEESVSENIEDYVDDTDENVDVYEQILKKNRNFSISHFMKGSSVAFELIIKYFNQGNLMQLKPLVDKNLYNNFAEKVEHRKELGETHESVIISIISQRIIEIKLVKNTVFIALCFLSEQINFTKDKKGNVISGSTSTINKVEDIWQFKKNINSSDPSWLLVSVNYEKADASNGLATNSKYH